ncbi:thyroid transcription factor 1-associated protein 26 homolog [Myxocyprinus asiaticus]|uniref:thyroid transcription factor 1-associated protein 26 homolog n=1 Tax=Myxocyprinus asiaticus TaxID=70543 RepID=UPI002222ECC2|nr:thyroid transcription factor 1-associated protein 26 homolog [Myxocyprinus asiaticus]
MAPIRQNVKTKGPMKGKQFKNNFAHGGPSHDVKRKRKWVPENKVFDGSLKEGQGFALRRKEKIKHEYNKLLRKERKKMQQSKVQLREEYPEHLKHLYLAEKERLEEEEQEKKKKRCKGRAVDEDEEAEGELIVPFDDSYTKKHVSNTMPNISSSDQSNAHVSSNEPDMTAQPESFHKAPLIQRKQKNLSSYQKTKQDYERIKEERARKREEFLKDKAQREEALKKYKEKKMATYQLLKRKTKKGQPNLNLQMELLLHKIQAQRK